MNTNFSKRRETCAKNMAKEALIDTMISLSGALYVYGKKSGDNHSQSLSKFTESDLKQMRDSDPLQKGKSLLEVLNQNMNNLANFGVSIETVTDFENKVSFYENALGGKDSKFAESKAARQKLNTLFDKANEILKEELDQMMGLIRPSQSGVYNQYAAARVIKDL